MAHAHYWAARDCWRAVFYGLWMPKGTHRTIRVPADRIKSAATAKQDATRYAIECEHLCRMVEEDPSAEMGRRAAKAGAINAEDLQRVLTGNRDTLKDHKGPPTIRDAYKLHPSNQRDNLADALKYERALAEFEKFAGSKLLADLTLPRIVDWVACLIGRGYAWDTRRHFLLPLKRAARMGSNLGRPDPIGRLRIDPRGRLRQPVFCWTLPHLMRAIGASADDHRLRAALALGGILGLRPTEILRLQVGDLDVDAGTLAIGAREAKNAASQRTLPLPASMLAWLRPCLLNADGSSRPGDDALINPRRNLHKQGPRRYALTGFDQWLSPALTDLARKLKVPDITPKQLRKTFTTWSAKVLTADDLERFMGHEVSKHKAVTLHSYLAPYQTEELRPAADLIERAITAAITALQATA